MKKKIKYTDEPMDLGTTIKDFLPVPENLVPKEEVVDHPPIPARLWCEEQF